MPKKFVGQNSKAVEATARKNATRDAKKAEEERAAEDALWADDNKHVKKKEERKQAREQKKNDKLEKKQENSKLLEEEESKLGGSKNQNNISSNKMTRYDIMVAQETTNASTIQGVGVVGASTSKTQRNRGDGVDEDGSADIGIERNMNREIGMNDTGARNVDEAIAQLNLNEDSGGVVDQHPEKRLKAAIKSYEKFRLPILKGEQPGLRLSQYKEIMWKEFQKSPQNPLNQ